MPSKSKSQQRFMGMVRAAQKGEKPVSAKVAKVAKSIDRDDAEDFASTKHKGLPNRVKKETKVRELIRKMVREVMAELKEGFAGGLPKSQRKAFDKQRRKQSEVLGYKLTGTDDMKVETDDATIKEAKKRDYKAEYKKYGSSTKAKKYRAELNAYNRKKGTYGNGDGKDASHKGGKIVGFEAESKNRGRAEKSRLKKEGKLTESMYAKLGSKVEKFVKQYHGKNKFVSLPSWKVTMTYPKQPGRTHNQWVNAKSAKDAIKISKMMWKNQDIKVANAVFDDETWLKIQKAQKTGFTEGKLTEKKKTIPFKDIPSYMKDHYPTQKHWDYYQSLPDGKKWMYYKKYPNILAKQSKKTDDFIAQQKKELGLEGKLQENEKNWNWSLDWESDISSLINSRELKTLMRDKNSKVKTIAQRLQKNLKQVHIGFDGLTDELRKVYGEGKLKEGKGVDKVLSMANDNSFGKLGGKTVDAMSANLFKTVYDKLTDSNKQKIDKMNEKQLYVFMTKLWTKFGKQVRI